MRTPRRGLRATRITIRLADASVCVEVDRRPRWLIETIRRAFRCDPGGRRPDFRVVRSPDFAGQAILLEDDGCHNAFTRSESGRLVEMIGSRIEERLALRASVPVLHAALVVLDRPVILLGASHAGKSTLAAWLSDQPGASYVTDEMVALESGGVDGFQRPLHLRRDGTVPSLVGWERWPGASFELHVPTGRLRSSVAGRPLAVVLDRREDDLSGEVDVERLSTAVVARLLADNSFNLLEPGEDRIGNLASAATGIDGIRLTYRQGDPAAARLASLAGSDLGRRAACTGPLAIAGRRGRIWCYEDSALVHARDPSVLVSVNGQVGLPSEGGTIVLETGLLHDLDLAFGHAEW